MSAAWIETRNMDGTLRKKWDDSVGVQLITPVDDPATEWERSEASSPWVDGVFETHGSIGRMTFTTHLEVTGASFAQVEHRRLALITDATSTHRVLLKVVIGAVSYTYRAYRPDVESPLGDSDIHGVRDVFLTWRVLPHPTITGTSA